jgi:hypothetical protein
MRCTLRERYLDQRDLKWEHVRNYALESLALTDDVRAQIRLGGSDPEHVEDFARLATAGRHRDAPPIFVFRRKRGDEIGDGIHRALGFLTGGVVVHDAYVIACDDEAVIQMVRRTANIELNGWGISREERLAHAVAMKRSLPDTALDVIAQQFGVSVHSLGKRLRTDDVRQDLMEQGFSAAAVGRLKDTHLEALYQHSPPIREAAARAIIQSSMTTPDTEEMLRQVKAKRTEASKLQHIAKVAEDYAPRARAGIKSPSSMRIWKTHIKALTNLCQNGKAAEMTSLQRDELRDELTQLWIKIESFVEGMR